MGPIKEGDRIATCGGVSGSFHFGRKTYRQWVGVIYEAKARKKDGVVTYRRTNEIFGKIFNGLEPSEAYLKELKAEAPCLWVDDVEQHTKVADFRNLSEKTSSLFLGRFDQQ